MPVCFYAFCIFAFSITTKSFWIKFWGMVPHNPVPSLFFLSPNAPLCLTTPVFNILDSWVRFPPPLFYCLPTHVFFKSEICAFCFSRRHWRHKTSYIVFSELQNFFFIFAYRQMKSFLPIRRSVCSFLHSCTDLNQIQKSGPLGHGESSVSALFQNI